MSSWLKRPLLGALPAGGGLGDGPREGLLSWEGEILGPTRAGGKSTAGGRNGPHVAGAN